MKTLPSLPALVKTDRDLLTGEPAPSHLAPQGNVGDEPPVAPALPRLPLPPALAPELLFLSAAAGWAFDVDAAICEVCNVPTLLESDTPGALLVLFARPSAEEDESAPCLHLVHDGWCRDWLEFLVCPHTAGKAAKCLRVDQFLRLAALPGWLNALGLVRLWESKRALFGRLMKRPFLEALPRLVERGY